MCNSPFLPHILKHSLRSVDHVPSTIPSSSRHSPAVLDLEDDEGKEQVIILKVEARIGDTLQGHIALTSVVLLYECK